MSTNETPGNAGNLMPRGFPTGIALTLAKLAGASVFVETGTYQGRTCRWAAGHFDKVHTIERAGALYQKYSSELRALGNVEPWLGDSRDVLPKILSSLTAQRAVFWLDGHWSGEETAGAGDECPLLGELAAILPRSGDVILIDDVRLILCAPPRPHDLRQWPTLTEIMAAFAHGETARFVQVVDDVMIAVPDTPALRQALAEYAQGRTTTDYEAQVRARAEADRSFLRRLRRRVQSWGRGQTGSRS